MNEQLEIDFDKVDKEIVEITKKKTTRAQHKRTVEGDLMEFKAKLNQKPPKSFLKKNSFYGNMYIPIEIVERMLSALYLSYNFVMNIPPTVEEGNIIFYIDVIVKHPVTGSTETYTGVSAVPIKPVNGTMRDVHPHIPAAKSYAIMNACKHIGRLFRAENDDITKVFDTYFEKKIELSDEEKAKDNLGRRLLKMIQAADSFAKLKKLDDDVTSFCQHKSDLYVGVAYNEKLAELKKKD